MTGAAPGTGADTIAIRWAARAIPLPTAALIAEDRAVAAELLRHVLDFPEDMLQGWTGVVAGSRLVALISPRPDEFPLPWVDGVRYLGYDTHASASAPPLLLPTNLEPSVPAALLYRAVRVQYQDIPEPIALWPSPTGLRLLSLADARTLNRAVVSQVYQRLLSSTAQEASLR